MKFTTQHLLKRLLEVLVEHRVDDRIQHGVGVTEPKEYALPHVAQMAIVSAQRHDQSYKKKRQPTDKEASRYYGYGSRGSSFTR